VLAVPVEREERVAAAPFAHHPSIAGKPGHRRAKGAGLDAEPRHHFLKTGKRRFTATRHDCVAKKGDHQ